MPIVWLGYIRHSPNQFVTEVNHNHGEVYSGSSPFCYWGQTQAWLHTLTELPNFWTRAIRMWSHNSSHRANLNLWLRALSILVQKGFLKQLPKYFRLIPGRTGSHRAIFPAKSIDIEHTALLSIFTSCYSFEFFQFLAKHSKMNWV